MKKQSLGPRLRQHRRAAGLTQVKLGAKLRYDHSRISRYERGKDVPSLQYLAEFIRLLQLEAGAAQELRTLYANAKIQTTVFPAPSLHSPQYPGRASRLRGALPIRQNGRNLEPHSYFELAEHEKLLAEIIQLVREPHPRYALCLCGSGGVGKTTLAIEAANRLLESNAFEDALWVSFYRTDATGETPASSSDAQSEFVRVLDDLAVQIGLEEVAKQSPTEKRQTIANHFWAKPYLVLLDNVDDSVDPLALTRQMQSVIGQSRLLLTLRDTRLAEIDSVWLLPIHGLGKRDSSAYVKTEAQRVGVPLTGATLRQMQQAYAFTGGVPYALKRVLSQIRQWGVDQAIASLATLSLPGAVDLYTHLFLKEWDSLDDDAHRLWIYLARMIPASITMAELADQHILTTALEPVLQPLLSRFLVDTNADRLESSTHLSLHPLSQQFIQQLAKLVPLPLSLTEYHQNGVVLQAAVAWKTRVKAKPALLAETSARTNILFCVRECARLGLDRHILELWDVVSTPLYESGYWNDYEQLEHLALRSARVLGERLLEAEINSELGWLAMERGEYPLARERTLTALEIFAALDNRRGIVISHRYLATMHIEQQQFAQARVALTDLLNMIQAYGMGADADLQTNLFRQEITTRDSLGIVLTALEEFEQAEQELQFGYEHAMTRGPSARAISLYNLGIFWNKRGDSARARNFLLECIDFSRQHTLNKTMADALFRLAEIECTARHTFQARERGEQARRLYNRIGATRSERQVADFLKTLPNE